jgi:hypothetical protein
MVFAVRVTPTALHKKCVFSYNSILTLLPIIMDHGYPADTPQKTAINYPFVYRIFSRCAKGIVIL